MTGDHRLKVGIDFGTEFSGISWIHTAKPDEVNVLTRWPDTNRAWDKVPSEIRYTPTGEVHQWGYEIRPSDERISLFKLLFQPTQYASASSSMLAGTKDLVSAKKPVNIITDYLSCLRRHFLEHIKNSLGKMFLDATPIDYTLTVPAIFTDATKALTLQAAEQAGFGDTGTIKLMFEQDAVVAWTLLREINPNGLKVGDLFVVVNGGEVTVDLISYEIQKLEPFTVRECVKGTGGMCGSVFLNEGFKKLVKSRIGPKFDKMKTATRNRLLKEWEEVLKREFSNSEEMNIFTCPIGGPEIPENSAKMGIIDGDFIITREEMLGIFDPVIDQIITLVQEQIDMVEDQNGGISAILLVGGFGESVYLFQRLIAELGETRKPSIEILQPRNAWSAVSRGAALAAEIRISSRKARRHYGVPCRTGFVHGKHPVKNLVYNSYTGMPMCDHWIKWFIAKGDQVSEEDKPISVGFSACVSIFHSLQITSKLVCCDSDTVPEYSNDTDGPPLSDMCTVHADLSVIPRKLFIVKIGQDGTPYYRINYNLVVTIIPCGIRVEVECQGQNYGTAKISYEHD